LAALWRVNRAAGLSFIIFSAIQWLILRHENPLDALRFLLG